MALVLKDRVKQTTTTTGTGSIVLNGNIDSFQTFAAALTDGDTTYYGIFEPSTNEYEIGLGTWTESSATLARTTVLESSNSGSAVSLTAQAEVFITQPAEKSVFLDANGSIPATAGALLDSEVTNLAQVKAFDETDYVSVTGDSMSGDLDMAGNKVLFGNVYSTTGDLPSASTYHGMFAHVHGTGKGYFAHAGNWVELANQADVTAAVNALVDSAPGTLDTLNELAAALGDDANFSTTVTNSIATKLPLSGGAMTGAITTNSTFDGRDVATDGAKLDGIEAGATADQTKADIDALGIAASTASTLATGRSIALSGDVSGSTTFDGSGNVTITATIADDSHNHVISNVDGLQTALDGKLSTSGKAADANLLDGLDLHTGRNNQANRVVRTQSNGYAEFGWINTTSGDTSAGLSRAYVDTGDGYIRKCTMSHLRSQMGAYPTSGGTISGNVTINGTLTLGGYTINDVEDIHLRDKLFHDGDTDTYLGFGTNTINLVTGNSTSATFNSSGIFVTDGSVAEDYDALSGTSPTCNVDNGGAFSLTMSGNTTFTFSGASSGYIQGFVLQLTGNGSTVTWPGSVKWAGGTAPDAPASGETDILVFHTRDGGSNWYGVLASDAAA